MAPPTARRVVNVIPAGTGGPTFTETWAGTAAAWDLNPIPWSDYAAPERAVMANDGLMGSRFLRLGSMSNTGHASWTQPLVTFDQTQPATFAYRFRASWAASYAWMGLGLLYNGETIYDGLTSEAWANGVGDIGLYGQGWQVGEEFLHFASGDIVDVEGRWIPSSWTLGYRLRINGGAWTDWNDRVNSAHTVAVAALGGGSAMLTPFTLYFFVESGTGGTVLDIGPVSITGSPMWGAEDFVGFDATSGWTLNGAAYISGDDASKVLGGLTGRESDGKEFIDHNTFAAWAGRLTHVGASVDASWSAQSPIIGLSPGCRYGYLDLHAHNPGSRLRVYVRNASTEALISDAVIPGNSTGLLSTASTAPSAEHRATATSGYVGRWTLKLLCNSVGPQRVDLSAVPAGTEIYLDVQGSTAATDTTYINQPRLGGVWLSIAQTLGASATDPVGNASVFSGLRPAGATVTVSGAATVGVVTYPTTSSPSEAGTSWSCNVSGIPGGTTVFTVTSSTGESLTLDVVNQYAGALPLASALGFASSPSDAFLVARNPMLARSWLAGPTELLDSPLDRADLRQSIVQSSTATFAAAWSELTALAHSHGFTSVSSFVAAWTKAQQIASALGFSSVSAYVLSIQASAAPWPQTLGFESSSAFAAAWSRTTALTERLGFASTASFLAQWNEASEYRATFGFLSSEAWLATFPELLRLSVAYGISSVATLAADWLASRSEALTLTDVYSADFWDDMSGALSLRWSVGLALSAGYLPGSDPALAPYTIKGHAVRLGMVGEAVRVGVKGHAVTLGILHGR